MLYHRFPHLFLLLPEVILTLTGVLIMLLEPMLTPGRSRKPLGWLAIFGTLAAGIAAIDQLRVQNVANALTGFHSSIRVDIFSIFFHLLIAAVVIVTLLASLDYFEPSTSSREIGHAGEYFALVCFGATGMMFMTCSVELLLVFIGLEISSISTYILAGFRKGQATASESSLKYFLLGSFATAFFLYGIALVYGATGSTSLDVISASLAATQTPRLAFLALAMLLVGLGFKVSAAPFHIWTPDVYQGAPAPVVGLMSTAPKAAAFAVILRIISAWPPAARAHWFPLIAGLSVLSMTLGNLGALMQRDVKRMLAYSSIAHAGYLLVAFAGTPSGSTSAVMFYTAAYAAMNVGAFVVITQIAARDESIQNTDDFTGLALRRPTLAALLAFFLISLIGIPFTAGFFGKFYAFSAAVQNNQTHSWAIKLVVIALINSGVACFYYLRLLAALYTRPASEPNAEAVAPTSPRLSAPAALALTATALATLGLGILPGRIVHFTQRATTRATGIANAVAETPLK